jgi:alpha-tubulin suppressor-like RCC1 family protein
MNRTSFALLRLRAPLTLLVSAAALAACGDDPSPGPGAGIDTAGASGSSSNAGSGGSGNASAGSSGNGGGVQGGSAQGGGTSGGGGSASGGAFTLVLDKPLLCPDENGAPTSARIGTDCQASVRVDFPQGSEDAVTLSVKGLPPGVYASISTFEPDHTVKAKSPLGTITIEVRGVAASGSISPTLEATSAAGGTQSVALPLTIVSPLGFPLARVSAGQAGTCGLNAAGQTYCWGTKDKGQIGLPPPAGDGEYLVHKPTAVHPGLSFANISAATGDIACALDVAGAAFCWGSSYLGDGTLTVQAQPTPVAVSGGLAFAELATGSAVCGVTTDGEVYCWSGSNGDLGNGTYDSGKVPTHVELGEKAVHVAAVPGIACALTTSGKAFCWGSSSSGNIPAGPPGAALLPRLVATSVVFTSIGVGSGHACGLAEDGKAYCWGSRAAGRVGDGVEGTEVALAPVAVTGGLTFQSLAVGPTGACGLDATGQAHCWGDVAAEKGSDPAPNHPVALRGEVTFSSLSLGASHACGIATNGLKGVYCWGANGSTSKGTLGTGDARTVFGPVPVVSP